MEEVWGFRRAVTAAPEVVCGGGEKELPRVKKSRAWGARSWTREDRRRGGGVVRHLRSAEGGLYSRGERQGAEDGAGGSGGGAGGTGGVRTSLVGVVQREGGTGAVPAG